MESPLPVKSWKLQSQNLADHWIKLKDIKRNDNEELNPTRTVPHICEPITPMFWEWPKITLFFSWKKNPIHDWKFIKHWATNL